MRAPRARECVLTDPAPSFTHRAPRGASTGVAEQALLLRPGIVAPATGRQARSRCRRLEHAQLTARVRSSMILRLPTPQIREIRQSAWIRVQTVPQTADSSR